MDVVRVEREGGHDRAGSNLGRPGHVWEPAHRPQAGNLPASVVPEQEVKARAPVEGLVVPARAARIRLRRDQPQVIADVRDEDVQVRVSVVVADGEAHPGADLVDAHGARNRDEPDRAGRGVVPVDVQPVPVVRHPEVGIAVLVVVEEGYRVSLAGRLPHPVAELVRGGRVVPLVLLPGLRVPEQDGLSLRVPHGNLRSLHPGLLRDLLEGQIAPVAVEHVVVSGVVRPLEVDEVVVGEIAHVYVEPAVAVHVCAGDRRRRADVDRAPKGCVRDVAEKTVPVVAEQQVGVALELARRPEPQAVPGVPPRADVEVLESVVVEVARRRAGRVGGDRRHPGLFGHVREAPAPVVAVEPVGVARLRRDVEVHVPVTVVVEHHDAGQIVPDLVAVLQRRGRRVGEGRDGRGVSLAGARAGRGALDGATRFRLAAA